MGKKGVWEVGPNLDDTGAYIRGGDMIEAMAMKGMMLPITFFSEIVVLTFEQRLRRAITRSWLRVEA